ncbi:MAG: nitronate monooxygenase [Halioglobus sp.]|nr:nitronate monooxygenase [Halioglobus sp.]
MQLSQLLGIDKGIIQAPMAGVQDWELAVAVAEAGGLGSIPCGMLSPQQLLAEISSFTSHSDKPYNLNFFCHTMPAADPDELRAWEVQLQGYYSELSVNPPTEPAALRLPFDEKIAELLEPHKPPILSFHFGLPSPALVQRIKSWGSIILSSATTVDEGAWLQQHGADVVIAQGIEAGGHRAMFLTSDPATQQATAELVRQLTRALSVPVVAAGGIAGERDTREMLVLGAAGVQVGTAYLLCDEAKTSPVHRKEIKAADKQTALTNIFSGRLARGICNRVMEDLGFVNDNAPRFPYAASALAPLRAHAEALDLPDFTPLWAGTNRAGCMEVSAATLTHELWPDS